MCIVCGEIGKCEANPVHCFDNLEYMGETRRYEDFFSHKPWVYPVSLRCGHTFSRRNLYSDDTYSATADMKRSCPLCGAEEEPRKYSEIMPNWCLLELLDELQVRVEFWARSYKMKLTCVYFFLHR